MNSNPLSVSTPSNSYGSDCFRLSAHPPWPSDEHCFAVLVARSSPRQTSVMVNVLQNSPCTVPQSWKTVSNSKKPGCRSSKLNESLTGFLYLRNPDFLLLYCAVQVWFARSKSFVSTHKTPYHTGIFLVVFSVFVVSRRLCWQLFHCKYVKATFPK